VGAQWLIVALGPFSLTMYQPALPSIATSLNITTAQVQLTSPSDGSSSLSTAIRFGMSSEVRHVTRLSCRVDERGFPQSRS